MATRDKSDRDKVSVPSGEKMRVGIIVADWNTEITHALLDGCKKTLLKHGVKEDRLSIQHVPGAYELPMGARLLATGEKFDVLICLGCIIKGETKHDEYIANAVSAGIMQLSLMLGVPVIFGVLTPNSLEQAKARSGGSMGNKGNEAAEAALQMAALKKDATSQPHKIGFA